MWGYSILLPGGYNGTFNADNFAAAGRGPYSSIIAGFPSATYNVSEGAGSAQFRCTQRHFSHDGHRGRCHPRWHSDAQRGLHACQQHVDLCTGATVLTVTVPITDDVVSS